jgi:hypothetical protein
MNTAPSRTAEQAYAAARERVDTLRSRLDELLDAHQRKQAEWRGDWGLVGDINHVAKILAEAVVFMEGGS